MVCFLLLRLQGARPAVAAQWVRPPVGAGRPAQPFPGLRSGRSGGPDAPGGPAWAMDRVCAIDYRAWQ